MATKVKTAEYELVLMLDATAPEQAREALAAETRTKLEGAGELRHAESWGIRKLAYEIEQRHEADYRFFRFQTEAPSLDELRHALRIADGILRFRIFEVDPQSPLMTPPEVTFGGSRERDGRGRGRRRDYDDTGAEEEVSTEAEPTRATQPGSAPEPPEAPPAPQAEEEPPTPEAEGSPEPETAAEDAAEQAAADPSDEQAS